MSGQQRAPQHLVLRPLTCVKIAERPFRHFPLRKCINISHQIDIEFLDHLHTWTVLISGAQRGEHLILVFYQEPFLQMTLFGQTAMKTVLAGLNFFHFRMMAATKLLGTRTNVFVVWRCFCFFFNTFAKS